MFLGRLFSMKIIPSLCFIALTGYSLAQKTFSLKTQANNILYQGGDNFVVIDYPGLKTYRIHASNAKITPASKKNHKGFNVNPNTPGELILKVSGEDINGKIIFGTVHCTVRPFPHPVLKNSSISKDFGGTLKVDFPANFSAGSFEIIDVFIKGQTFDGPTVPAGALNSLQRGDTVGIMVRVKYSITATIMDIPCSLLVK